jgi:Na+/proline symporter
MPSVAAARRSLLIKGVATAVVSLLFFFLGTTLFAFYMQHPAAPDAIFPLPKEKQDLVTAHFVQFELPFQGLLGLLLAGLAAAMMSTISGGLNSLSALVVSDWLPGRKLGVKASRFVSALFGALAIGMAILAPYLGDHVFDILMKIAGAFFGPLFGLFLLGMLMPRANSQGAMAGLAAGLLMLVVIFPTNIASWWYGLFTFVRLLWGR